MVTVLSITNDDDDDDDGMVCVNQFAPSNIIYAAGEAAKNKKR
jgi:hypothetical protein